MVEAIQQLFKNIFGDNAIFATVVISMLPIIELRGGIPFGMSETFWGKNALSSWQSMWWSFLGSSMVVPVLALIFIPMLNWLKKTKLFKRFATKVEEIIKSKSDKIENKHTALNNGEVEDEIISEKADEGLTNNKIKQKVKYDKSFFGKLLGVTLFVAIPLPLTGVWTGTAVAVMLGIPFGWTCLSVILGNLIAGIIMQTICAIFPDFTTWILIIFLCLTALLVIIAVIKNKLKNKQKTI